jgi:hypothetical protein
LLAFTRPIVSSPSRPVTTAFPPFAAAARFRTAMTTGSRPLLPSHTGPARKNVDRQLPRPRADRTRRGRDHNYRPASSFQNRHFRLRFGNPLPAADATPQRIETRPDLLPESPPSGNARFPFAPRRRRC